MDDDFNTPKAVSIIYDFVRAVNSLFAKHDNIDVSFYKEVRKFLEATAQNVLGILKFDKPIEQTKADNKEDELIQLLIDIRSDAKKNKNFELADMIRDRLNELGFQLTDTKSGATVKRK
ncbi:MAG: DALR domain-containing protein [Melioribacteraceae bacterium]|nr:DALR domain-containing protein [Melioribacteraceae bacterium]